MGASLVLCLLSAAGRVETAPVVVWHSDPVRPDETVLLYGAGFSTENRVEVVRLPDGNRAEVAEARLDWNGVVTVPVLQASERSLKFALPADLKPGLLACRVTDATGGSVQLVLNRPSPLWVQGDGGGYGTPGGFVQAMGRCVAAPGAEPALMLSGAVTLVLPASPCTMETNEFAVRATLPGSLAEGEYQVRVHNGYGGVGGWSEPQAFSVRAERRPQTTFAVTDFGADGWDGQDDTLAVIRTLEAGAAAGGGVVYFPAGRYLLSAPLELARHVTLKGESRESAILAWPDTDSPPPAWVSGSDHFALEDLTLYCSNHRNVIQASQGQPDSGAVRIEQVRVRANLYNHHRTEDEVDQRFRESLKLSTGGGDTLRLGGKDVVVRDCDLYGSGRCLYLSGGQGALISGNRFSNGRWGWYCISGSDGVIFEENEIVGGDLMSTGGGLNCLDGSMCSQNIYYAHNRLRTMFGWDREAMTSDAGGGAYAGPVAAADAGSVTCAADPDWGNRNWQGAAVFVLDGRGMGQYRRIAAHEGRAVTVDRPWEIVPDDTSIISVTMLQRHYLLIGNRFEDAGIGIQFFGTSVDHICAGNTSARTGGFHNWGLDYYGKQPTWFLQWLDNRITEGNAFSTGGAVGAHLATFCTPPGDWNHPLALGAIMRRNELSDGAVIEFGAANPATPPERRRLSQTAVIEHNTVRRVPTGITVLEGTPDVLVRDNTFDRVDMPLFDEQEIARRREARRRELAARNEPVLELHLDEAKGAVTPDSSGMGLDAVLEGNVDLTQEGVRGKCVTLDGESRLVVPRGSLLDLDTVTVSAWIRPARLDGRFGIVTKRNSNSGAPYVLTAAGGGLGFEACDATGAWSYNFSAPGVLRAGEWQHVACVLEHQQGGTLYVDGKPVASKENRIGVQSNGQPLCIGWEAWGGPSAKGENLGFFFGSVDEVSIWARALTPDEISQLAQKP